MFKKKILKEKSLEIHQQEISTLIGEGYTFTGELQGGSVIRIEGKVIGNVNVEGGIVLGEKGIIEGDVNTKSAIIFGRLQGNIKAVQLEIKKSGQVNGDITTGTLEIELGALFNGKLNMQKAQLMELEKAS